jgi:hypothetical protein
LGHIAYELRIGQGESVAYHQPAAKAGHLPVGIVLEKSAGERRRPKSIRSPAVISGCVADELRVGGRERINYVDIYSSC